MDSAIPNYPLVERGSIQSGAGASGVSWAAVFAGASVSAALALILFALGAGLGLSSVSFWSNVGASAAAIGTATIVWLIAMQIISSAMGGYIAGRLRTKWTGVHTDEVYFRDTAHGFLSWSVALVVTAAFLTSATAALVGGTGSPRAAGGAQAGQSFGSNAYFVDALFRSTVAKVDSANVAADRSEAGTILVTALEQGSLAPQDRSYLAFLISSRTGMSPAEADKQVGNVYADAAAAAERTRKAVAHSLLWAFIALLIGAFSASVAATIGGRQRDHVVMHHAPGAIVSSAR